MAPRSQQKHKRRGRSITSRPTSQTQSNTTQPNTKYEAMVPQKLSGPIIREHYGSDDDDDDDYDDDFMPVSSQPESKELEGTLPKIECTFPDCQNRFHTIKEMRRHKDAAPEHDYCKKCDCDCEDWDDLVQHKINAMAPWLDHSAEEGTNPKHIVCEFCGMDFKSFGGRRIHRENTHKADHEVRCPGCQSLFSKAAKMIAHLESGECDIITADEFMARIHHKRAVAQIMKNPDVFHQNLINNQNSLTCRHPDEDEMRKKTAKLTDGSETIDKEDGGVSVIDTEHSEQQRGYKPLTPEADLTTGVNLPLTRQNLESWPRKPGQDPSHIDDAMRKISISSSAESTFSADMTDVTSRRGGRRVYTEASIYGDNDAVDLQCSALRSR